METLRRKDIAEKLAEKTGVYKKDCEAIMKALPEVVKEAIKEDSKICIYEFVTVKGMMTKERQGTNPRTKEKIIIPAKKRISVKFSENFKRECQ